MPIYEYYCPDCDKTIERIVKFGETARINCPDCGKKNLEKLISTFSSKGSATACPSSIPGGG